MSSVPPRINVFFLGQSTRRKKRKKETSTQSWSKLEVIFCYIYFLISIHFLVVWFTPPSLNVSLEDHRTQICRQIEGSKVIIIKDGKRKRKERKKEKKNK